MPLASPCTPAMQDKNYYIYLVASRTHILYMGVTSHNETLDAEHSSIEERGLTACYGIFNELMTVARVWSHTATRLQGTLSSLQQALFERSAY